MAFCSAKQRSNRCCGNIFDNDSPVLVAQVLDSLLLELQNHKDDQNEKPDEAEDRIHSGEVGAERMSNAKCRICGLFFDSRLEQAQHFQTDWHRHNVKLNFKGKDTLSEQQFDDLLSDDEVSTSSDESDADTEYQGQMRTFLRQSSQTYFVDRENNQVYSLYKALGDQSSNNVSEICQSNRWIIFLLAGGRFCGAVFHGEAVVAHKTFHRYTVRAKQGGAQGARDSQQPHKAPRSAGANLRRYNEKALCNDIQSLLAEWKLYLAEANLIFLRCSTYHRHIFFGSNESDGPLLKSDSRVKSVPFVTKRPTFDEARKVHQKLSSVYIHGSLEQFLSQYEKCRRAVQSSRVETKKARPKTIEYLSLSDSEPDDGNCGKRSASLATESEEPKAQHGGDNEEIMLARLKQRLYTICKTGEAQELIDFVEEESQCGQLIKSHLSAQLIGPHRQTFLHQAAAGGNLQMLDALLKYGCDPTITNKNGQVPFQVAANRPTRLCFSQFRDSSDADLWDWNKAQIPPLPTEEQQNQSAEKRRRARQNRKERQKVKKEEEAATREEEGERQRYLHMSDREKRALAAERRILSACEHDGQPTPVLARCFCCATDMSGRVPFEYSDNRFCSIKCLQEHRKNNGL